MCDHSANPPKRRHFFSRWYAWKEKWKDALVNELEGRREDVSDEEFRNRDANLKVSKSKYSETLKVQSVDFHSKYNREKHHTDEYEQEDLIVRRGSPFYLSFTFQRNIKPDADSIVLQFVTGDRPKQSKSTINRLRVLSPHKTEKQQLKRQLWKAKHVELKGKTIKIEVTPAANCFVGVYEVYLETKNVNDPEDTPERYQHQDDIYILFNTWCKEDPVHMEHEDDRNEYVLNESGLIWVGSVCCNHGRPWNFGQFDEPCLDAALVLLKTAGLPENGYKNPISVIRCLSAIINSCDDDGLLEGRWTEHYPKDCTEPCTWTGSVAILKEYMETKKSVRYGQCWVFSGVMTTLLRALGIPTRSVTNFQSAHDKDCSMTIDFHFKENGKPMTFLDDSVWNFHVWNESWLKRPDLPAGYDGWQAHDATPQECSEGIMQCGPAPLKAIKEGQVYLLYDVSFIFAEVNGDRVSWMVTDDWDMIAFNINKNSVGKLISTKAVGSDERDNITCLYKYPEGSEDERRVVKFVNQFSSRAEDDIYDLDVVKDVEFEFEPPTKAEVGEGFEIKLKMKSLSDSVRKIDVVVTLMSSFYTGIAKQEIKAKNETIELKPKKEFEFQLPVGIKDYETHLGSDASFTAFVNCKVHDTKQCFITVEKVTLKMPDLVIKCPKEMEKGTEAKMTITFTNPLSLNLTNVVLNVESLKVVPLTTFREKFLPPKSKFVKEVTLHPKSCGYKRVVAILSSDQLKGIEDLMCIFTTNIIYSSIYLSIYLSIYIS
ncbi:TGM1 [Acanthosepion pharaonis]|uniref:TGM1 n=1 Tax=Acanthosepion pharaonis TaxID=158019 RepID=A0A812ECP1_ACAPH|nr:TGM1 [Sepia pharaonis]